MKVTPCRVEGKSTHNSLQDEPPANESILAEADRIAGHSRSRDYGHPHPNHKRIATLWNAMFACWGEKPAFTPGRVAQLMILLKLARHANARKRDNLVDAAGYLKCLDMIEDAEECMKNGMNGPNE